jgi:streptomycin 6-kinase
VIGIAAMNQSSPLPAVIRAVLVSLGFLGVDEPCSAEPMGGGVSSDIWKVQLHSGPVCVKRALGRLKVAAEWSVPVTRNACEVAWFRVVAGMFPDAVPRILGHDAQAGVFLMEYLPPESYPLWKNLLRDGVAEESSASRVAQTLVAIHAGTARDAGIARIFANDSLFLALRPEPYLLTAAKRHPEVGGRLKALVDTTMANKKVLVHGDVSPKNILLGPKGPVFLDAETAWYGDPAFDLAFCLNHLLLKCLWNPPARGAFLGCYLRFRDDYLRGVNWEPAPDLERRAAHLLPGLLLARIDGKSPVEYLSDAGQQQFVRTVALELLTDPADSLSRLAAHWSRSLERFLQCDIAPA